MKILVQFSNQDNRAEIITPFIGLDGCESTDTELKVPGIVKIDYSKSTVECFCLGLDVVEKILSNICNVKIDSVGNSGMISFPKSLSGVMLETQILDFKRVLELAGNGTVQYVNTQKQSLKATVPLSQWLVADLVVDGAKVYIKFRFLDYEINVNDGSAMQFCNRVKQHPLISVASLGNYFDFGSEISLKPNLDYLLFWKVLKSENGYKKYSNFINEMNDRINVIYDEGKKYRCQFDGGFVDFQLLSMGDKYPKKVVVQIDEIKDTIIIDNLLKNLGFKTIELVGKVTNLKLRTDKLLHQLKFYKDDNFFVFSSVRDNLKAEYDIGSGTLSIKQEFHIVDKIDKVILEENYKLTKNWIDMVIKEAN